MAAEKHLKMAKAFPGGTSGMFHCWDSKQVKYAVHAIHSHDELVAEVCLLRESNRRMAHFILVKLEREGKLGILREAHIHDPSADSVTE